MSYNEFKLCKGCPIKGARYFDPDGYWCCKHPDAKKHAYEPEQHQGGAVPFVCMKTCPANHWKRTTEGGLIPKGQTELLH